MYKKKINKYVQIDYKQFLKISAHKLTHNSNFEWE